MGIHDVVVVYQAYGLLKESLPLGSVSFDMRGWYKTKGNLRAKILKPVDDFIYAVA